MDEYLNKKGFIDKTGGKADFKDYTNIIDSSKKPTQEDITAAKRICKI
jgi:hypothetical protein